MRKGSRQGGSSLFPFPSSPWANRAWALASRRSARDFRRALARPEAAGLTVLREIVGANQDSEVGRRFGFGEIRSLSDWQRRLPLTDWSRLGADVDRIAHGEAGVLTSEPVTLLEPTGGSSGGTKLIPYTATLQRQIRRAVAAWIADLFANVPRAMDGPAYWSVSPAMATHRSPGGVPIGFEDDGAYLSPLHRWLSRSVMAVPASVRSIEDVDAFRYATLRHLVSRRDLALVSVWNPTFFSLLLAPLREWGNRLARDLPPEPGARLRAALAEPEDADLVQTLWPRLALVSAWADAAAAGPARDLQALTPHARFQPKGLVATEGIVTIPLIGHEASAPALTSHLVELLPEAGGAAIWAHEAEVGQIYSVVLSTGGGLYRYRLGDRVEVVGRVERAPLLRFVGREGGVVDLVGEKLHEVHVAEALRDSELSGFAMLAPLRTQPPGYALFLEADSPHTSAEAARRVETRLRANVHYDLARRLGQLAPLRAFAVSGDGRAQYLAGCARLGQRLGDVKPTALHREAGWETRFEGGWV